VLHDTFLSSPMARRWHRQGGSRAPRNAPAIGGTSASRSAKPALANRIAGADDRQHPTSHQNELAAGCGADLGQLARIQRRAMHARFSERPMTLLRRVPASDPRRPRSAAPDERRTSRFRCSQLAGGRFSAVGLPRRAGLRSRRHHRWHRGQGLVEPPSAYRWAPFNGGPVLGARLH
jgi:hypothetical protein